MPGPGRVMMITPTKPMVTALQRRPADLLFQQRHRKHGNEDRPGQPQRDRIGKMHLQVAAEEAVHRGDAEGAAHQMSPRIDSAQRQPAILQPGEQQQWDEAKRFRKKMISPVGTCSETPLMTASIKVKVRTARLARMMPATARSRVRSAAGPTAWAAGVRGDGLYQCGLAGKRRRQESNNIPMSAKAPRCT